MTTKPSNNPPVLCDSCKSFLLSRSEPSQKILDYLWHQFGKFQCCDYAKQFLQRLEQTPFFKTKLLHRQTVTNGWINLSVLAMFPDPNNQQDYALVSRGNGVEVVIVRQKDRPQTFPLSIHSTIYPIQKNDYGVLWAKPFHDEVLGGEEMD